MIGCEDQCPREMNQQDLRSVGVVEDIEVICRAAYDPIAFNKSGNISAAIIRSRDLFDGELSIWRISAKAKTTLDGIVAICEKNVPQNNELREVRGITAGQIRNERRPEIDGQLFCVVDETQTDDHDGSHPAHGHIKICSQIMSEIDTADHPTYRLIKETLTILFKKETARIYPLNQPAA